MDLHLLLQAVEQSSPVDVVDVLGGELARTVGAGHVALLIADFSGNAVIRLSHVEGTGREQDGHNERGERLLLRGTAHGEVMLSQTVRMVEGSAGWLVLVPVTERGDAIGVLEVSFSGEPDAELLSYLVAAAHALAYVLISSRRHTDLFEWAQRDVPFSISAEIQRRLLPSAYSMEAGPLTLSGWLEPSHDAGGDTFDYCLDREHLYLSVTDAMGHTVDAALLATLTVGTLRNTRRALASPAELPLGIATEPYRTEALALLPGDRLLVITDGYLDRAAGRLDIEQVMRATPERHPRQVVQELARRLLEVTGGDLYDDATALCLDWYGEGGVRAAAGGASQERATT